MASLDLSFDSYDSAFIVLNEPVLLLLGVRLYNAKLILFFFQLHHESINFNLELILLLLI
jgi:hypothetical protein